jgi:hypothetical protein
MSFPFLCPEVRGGNEPLNSSLGCPAAWKFLTTFTVLLVLIFELMSLSEIQLFLNIGR